MEAALGTGSLFDEGNLRVLTAVQDALHAHALLRRDVDYVVKNDSIELVDEFKGRVAENRPLPLVTRDRAPRSRVGREAAFALAMMRSNTYSNLLRTINGRTLDQGSVRKIIPALLGRGWDLVGKPGEHH